MFKVKFLFHYISLDYFKKKEPRVLISVSLTNKGLIVLGKCSKLAIIHPLIKSLTDLLKSCLGLYQIAIFIYYLLVYTDLVEKKNSKFTISNS